jgi:hypothetical protein
MISFVTEPVRNDSELWLASARGITSVPINVIDSFRVQNSASHPCNAMTPPLGGRKTCKQQLAMHPAQSMMRTASVVCNAERGCQSRSEEEHASGVQAIGPSHWFQRGWYALSAKAGEVSVPVRTNRFQFQFTAVDLVSPQRLTFRYRLAGFESEWHDADGAHFSTAIHRSQALVVRR